MFTFVAYESSCGALKPLMMQDAVYAKRLWGVDAHLGALGLRLLALGGGRQLLLEPLHLLGAGAAERLGIGNEAARRVRSCKVAAKAASAPQVAIYGGEANSRVGTSRIKPYVP